MREQWEVAALPTLSKYTEIPMREEHPQRSWSAVGILGGFVTACRCGLAAVLSAMFVAPVFGEPLPCSDPMFFVDAPDKSMAQDLCTLAADIRGHLEGCGLKQDRELTIEMVDELRHPLSSCLAYFDCEFDLVRVLDPAAYDKLLGDDEPYAGLPPEITLRALLAHEITHALVTQTADDRKVPLVDHEYIAAAMELELMDEAWREVLLAKAPVDLPPKESLISIWVYGFAPRKFGVNAWQHFRLPENGCSLVQRIVDGDASFQKSIRPELR